MSTDIKELEKRMHGAMDALKKEFGGLRTGRASVNLLDPVMVEAYGQRMPLNQVGTVSAPEPRLLSVSVWDKSLVTPTAKAIRDAVAIVVEIRASVLVLEPVHVLGLVGALDRKSVV